MSFFDERATPRMSFGAPDFQCPYCGYGRSSATATCDNCGWEAPRSDKEERREARTERRQERTERRQERAADLAVAKARFMEKFNEGMAEQATARLVIGLLLMPYTIHRWRKVRHAQKRSYWAIPHSSQDYEELGRMTWIRAWATPVVTQIIKAVQAKRK